jgi:hypothetical protein
MLTDTLAELACGAKGNGDLTKCMVLPALSTALRSPKVRAPGGLRNVPSGCDGGRAQDGRCRPRRRQRPRQDALVTAATDSVGTFCVARWPRQAPPPCHSHLPCAQPEPRARSGRRREAALRHTGERRAAWPVCAEH